MTELKSELELLVLLAALRLGDAAYPVSIVEEIEARSGRSVHRATVYVAVQRMEERGLVETWLGEPLAERGGRPRRHVRVTAAGVRAARGARATLRSMWGGLEPLLEDA